jgi:hypothetical protein
VDPTPSEVPHCGGQRRVLIRELAQSLAQSQRALLAFDLADFESQTVQQAELCCALARLAGAEESSLAELARVESDLRSQVRLYAAVLRRARRTVEVFCRVLASSGATYTVPGATR